MIDSHPASAFASVKLHVMDVSELVEFKPRRCAGVFPLPLLPQVSPFHGHRRHGALDDVLHVGQGREVPAAQCRLELAEESILQLS